MTGHIGLSFVGAFLRLSAVKNNIKEGSYGKAPYKGEGICRSN